MTRGTTPTLRFSVGIDTNNINQLYITFGKFNRTIFEKSIESISIEKDAFVLRLTQEDTLKLPGNELVEIQIRVKYNDGTAIASDVIKASVRSIIKDGEI